MFVPVPAWTFYKLQTQQCDGVLTARYLDFTVDLDEFAMASNLDKCLNVRNCRAVHCQPLMVQD